MTSLLDIGPVTKKVMVQDKEITCRGLSAEGIFYLISTFPNIKSILEGRGQSIDAKELIGLAGPAISGLIACGTTPRNAYEDYQDWADAVTQASSVAADLGADAQLDLLNAVLGLTFSKEGVGPFMRKVRDLMGTLGSPVDDLTLPTSLTTTAKSEPKNGQSPLPTNLRGPLGASLHVDTPPGRQARGAIPLDS